MKNCKKCEYFNYNIDDFESKIFRCDRNKSKRFNHPYLHGWLCRHYTTQIIKKEGVEDGK